MARALSPGLGDPERMQADAVLVWGDVGDESFVQVVDLLWRVGAAFSPALGGATALAFIGLTIGVFHKL